MDDTVNLSHSHCKSCFNLYCSFTDDPVITCNVVECELLCGARFHQCKEQEHRLLCPSQRVPCINAVYGCSSYLPRSSIPSHLEVCPASVIHCTMEWNRWPVYSSERQSHQPAQILSNTNTDQLDIALALRDQRMLTQSMRASRKTRQILTTSVNRKHPAVPLDKQLTNQENVDEIKELEHLLQTMQDEKSEEEQRRARTPPGLRDSICRELTRGKLHEKQAEHCKNSASEYDLPFYPPEIYNAYPYIHCSHCERRKERLERILGTVEMDCHHQQEEHQHHQHQQQEEQQERMEDEVCDEVEYDMRHPPEDRLPATNGSCHKINGDINHQLEASPKSQNSDQLESSPKSQHSNQLEASPKSQHSSSASSDMDFQPPAVFVTSSTTGDLSAAPSRGYAKLLVIQPKTCVSSFSKNSLGLDLSMESITRYQTKPDSMYTFLCAQEFRRDEFANHFKNVHIDIHGGMNGWLEQRCPLALYGCTYSQRRFYPGAHGAKIVHSQTLESFGLQMDGAVTENGLAAMSASASAGAGDDQLFEDEIHPDYLSNLPFELLQYLFSFLDSFSMSNVAMTSKLLRQVCSSLLEERGMVVLLWEKQPAGWRISYKTWRYSTSFTPVHSWGFEDYAPIGQHLGTCPYNIRCNYPDKVQVMGKEAASRKRKPNKAEKASSDGQDNDL